MKRGPKVDLTGQLFGRWTVTGLHSQLPPPSRVYLWSVVCECGNKSNATVGDLKSGRTTQCLQCRYDSQGAKSRLKLSKYPDGEFVSGSYLTQLHRRNQEVTISVEDLDDVWKGQQGICALSGRRLTLKKTLRDKGDASVDRVNSDKGYIPGNIQWVHKKFNQLKSDHSMQEFVDMCREVAVHFGGEM